MGHQLPNGGTASKPQTAVTYGDSVPKNICDTVRTSFEQAGGMSEQLYGRETSVEKNRPAE